MFVSFRAFGKKTSLDGVFVYGGRLIMVSQLAPFRFYVGFTIENATTSARACIRLLEDVHRI